MSYFIVKQTAFYLASGENERQAAMGALVSPPLFAEHQIWGERFEAETPLDAYKMAHEIIAKARRA